MPAAALTILSWRYDRLVGRPLVPWYSPLAERDFDITAKPVRDLGLLGAEDDQVFFEARKAADVVISKDIDFVAMLERHGSPPKIIWLTCGNTSDAALRLIFTARFREAQALLASGASLVEIGAA